MTGWEKIDCTESDDIRGDHKISPASSLTDPNGKYSSGVVFTEWWSDSRPLLRDYRYTGEDKPCEHYVASFDGSAARGDDE